jgi:hypothetical protein
MRRGLFGLALLGLLIAPREASAQLDPLLYLKRTNSPGPTATGKPTVLIAVDTANRMQRDLNGDYRDDNIYRASPARGKRRLASMTPTRPTSIERKFVGLINTDSGALSDKFNADHIEIVGESRSQLRHVRREHAHLDRAPRADRAINRNSNVVRFGLLRMRQNAPAFITNPTTGANKWNINEGPVLITNPAYAAQSDQRRL